MFLPAILLKFTHYYHDFAHENNFLAHKDHSILNLIIHIKVHRTKLFYQI